MSAFIVGRLFVCGEDMVNQWRTIPTDGKHEMCPGAENTGFTTYTFLDVSSRFYIIKDKVAVVNYAIKSPIGILDNFVL